VLLLFALLVGTLLVSVAPAAANDRSCGQQVIDDWYGDGRVDGTYPLHCYRDAIKKLPEDVVVYSSAKEDIERALANRVSTTTTTTTPTETGGTSTTPADTTETQGTTTTPRVDPNGPNDDGDPSAVGDTQSASSVPVPLLVLGGLALLLMAAGGIGYLTRRMQARRAGGPDDQPPDL
jgi:hypothetical protein